MKSRARNKSHSICWKCRNAVPEGEYGCSWSRDLVPVEGWVAEATVILNCSHRGKGHVEYRSYNVKHCPMFIPDKSELHKYGFEEVPVIMPRKETEVDRDYSDAEIKAYQQGRFDMSVHLTRIIMELRADLDRAEDRLKAYSKRIKELEEKDERT